MTLEQILQQQLGQLVFQHAVLAARVAQLEAQVKKYKDAAEAPPAA